MFNIKKEYLIVTMLVFIVGFFSLKSPSSKANFNPSKSLPQKQIVVLNDEKIDNPLNRPVPIEIAQKKKDRKKFKKSRKEYIDLIHKRETGLDWEKMDSEYRKDRALKNTNFRKDYINRNGYWDSNSKEIFLERELEGVWEERGSNNLAGRVHTVDVDFENDLIYLASSGGNIWKGTIDGENWQSLNDYMQINDIKIVRLIETGNIRRLLIGSSDGFFYTDDEGVIINQSSGLDSPLDWGEFYRFIIKYHSTYKIKIWIKYRRL